MQRTDFLTISDALRAARNIATATRDTQAVRGVELAAVTIAGSLAARCGPRFDQPRFLADAGVSHAAEGKARTAATQGTQALARAPRAGRAAP